MENSDVAVVGYYGRGNLGDDLLASYVLDVVTQAVSAERTLVTAPDNSYLERWFPGISPVSLDEAFASKDGAVRKIVLGGGGLLFAFERPTLRNFYGARCSTAWMYWRRQRRTGRQLSLYAFCIGVGPLHGWGARWITQTFLANFEHVSVRDLASAKLLNLPNVRVVADPSISFESCTSPDIARKTASVAIVIRHWPYADLGSLFDNLRRAAHILRDQGWFVQFLSFQPGYDEQILKFLKEKGEKTLDWDPEVQTIREFCQNLSRFRVLVSMRAHGIYLSSLLKIAPIAITLDAKLEIAATKCGYPNNILKIECTEKEIVRKIKQSGNELAHPSQWQGELQALEIESQYLRSWLNR